MITINTEKQLIRVDVWASIIERAGFSDDLDPKQHELKAIIGRYAFKDIYRFDVYSVRHLSVSEEDVCGDLSLMTRNMSARDLPYVELKSPRESFSGHVGDTLAMLECHDYPESADVVSATLELGDVGEDVYGHDDFLAF